MLVQPRPHAVEMLLSESSSSIICIHVSPKCTSFKKIISFYQYIDYTVYFEHNRGFKKNTLADFLEIKIAYDNVTSPHVVCRLDKL